MKRKVLKPGQRLSPRGFYSEADAARWLGRPKIYVQRKRGSGEITPEFNRDISQIVYRSHELYRFAEKYGYDFDA